jgi:hypothetical protein
MSTSWAFSAGYLVNNHVLRVIALRYGQPDQTIHFEDFLLCIVRLQRMISEKNISRVFVAASAAFLFLCRHFPVKRRNELEIGHFHI